MRSRGSSTQSLIGVAVRMLQPPTRVFRKYRAPWSADHGVIFGVGPDPEPEDPIWDLHPDRAMTEAHPHRPEGPHLLEMERGVARIGFQQGKRFIGEVLNDGREGVIPIPEGGCGVVRLRGVERPAA